MVVSDIARVHGQIASLIANLDRPTPQVMISAKIIFVNRTDLSELGLSYELKDSQGNQLNVLAPGAARNTRFLAVYDAPVLKLGRST